MDDRMSEEEFDRLLRRAEVQRVRVLMAEELGKIAVEDSETENAIRFVLWDAPGYVPKIREVAK